MEKEHVLDLDICAIANFMRSGKTSSVALMDEIKRRHADFGKSLNAYKYWDEERFYSEAKALDLSLKSGRDKGLLMGIPISLKDLYGVKGMPIYAGSPEELPKLWREEGAVATSLLGAGSIVVGKTHTVEFAYGGIGTNSHWGTPVNPWDPNNHRVTGGSSSGAGVSLCQGSALIAMGTDTGGSVRIPASVTGNVGLKITINRWSTSGIVPLSSTFDTPGPLTRTVSDSIVAFGIIDPSYTNPVVLLRKLESFSVSNFNVAICDEYFWENCEPSVVEVVNDAITELSSKGLKISKLSLPEAALARHSSLKGGIFGAEGQSFIEEYYPERMDTLDPNVAERFTVGKEITAIDYLKAIRRISKLAREANEKMCHIDAIVAPTIPVAPPIVEQVKKSNSYKKNLGQMTQNTHPANLLEMCAITIPVGLDRSGMPIGLQLIARGGSEERLLALAFACEKVLGTARNRIGTPPRCSR